MNKAIPLLLLVATSIIVISGASGCQSGPPPATIDEGAVRAYADPATEVTLQGFSENDLVKYTQYGNAGFKAAVTQEILDRAATQVGSQLGTYESKEFLRAEEQEGYVVVHYRATYTKGKVGVRMVFDGEHLVAGHFFE